MSDKPYICIHGHFYQPPRENPWLEEIELQDSAFPYHDWNERIDAECYARNGASRILDEQGRIAQIVNNYGQISFDVGPTLMAWLEQHAPDTYQWILEGDRLSQQRFSGHGSAIAHGYNHLILPLANSRDKWTQVYWGIRDFEYRFGRKPEGFWLPETAVDLETLEILAEHGIQFTILAPHQASKVRPIGGRAWRDVSGGKIDPTMPYRLRLPNGRSITLFFYDGPISQAVAFERLLDSGEAFAQRLLSAYDPARTWPQLIHIATDGETYGHHHRFGEMALSYALYWIEQRNAAILTNYGEFLEKFPPTHEVQIYEYTSWSCFHGVERWRSNCGCNTGGHPGWQQEWRRPLREAMDWLRDELAPFFEQEASGLFKDPWDARNEYIRVILDRRPETVEAFFEEVASRQLTLEEKVKALKLLEMQRHAMLMYTSCGWFFDEISGIETVQVMQYAARAMQLAEELGKTGLEQQYLKILEAAPSNIPEFANGRYVYEKFVKPARVDLAKVGAHYAVSSLFDHNQKATKIYCYEVEPVQYELLTAGRARMALGRVQVKSTITWEQTVVTFAVLHMGDHNVAGGVRRARETAEHQIVFKQLAELFKRGDFPELLRVLDEEFEGGTYTLKYLFRDEQRRILRVIMDSALSSARELYQKIYEDNAPLMRFITSLGIPLPRRFRIAAEYSLNVRLREALSESPLDRTLIENLLEEARAVGIQLEAQSLEFALRRNLDQTAAAFKQAPADLGRLNRLLEALEIAKVLPLEVNLWTVENDVFVILKENYPAQKQMASNDAQAAEWVRKFHQLCELLRIRVE